MKIIQLFDTFAVRFGVMVVGPTGAGKTTCYETLANVMTSLRENGSTNPIFQVILFSKLGRLEQLIFTYRHMIFCCKRLSLFAVLAESASF